MNKMADKIILTSGKRRTAIARSRLMKSKSGKENIRINVVPIELVKPEFSKIRMMEPLILAKDFIKDVVDTCKRLESPASAAENPAKDRLCQLQVTGCRPNACCFSGNPSASGP